MIALQKIKEAQKILREESLNMARSYLKIQEVLQAIDLAHDDLLYNPQTKKEEEARNE